MLPLLLLATLVAGTLGQATSACDAALCPDPSCSNAYTPPGGCCPQCPDCSATLCPLLLCPGQLYYVPGECCPKCRDPVCTDAKTGETYQPGQAVPTDDPCERCYCLDSGDVICAMESCFAPTCTKPIQKPGMCCAWCPEKVCRVPDSGRWYAEGDVPRRNPCVKCRCGADGAITCQVTACPKLGCLETVTPPGKCCPVCL